MALATTACGRLGFSDDPLDGGLERFDAPAACAKPRWKVERIIDELTSLATDWSPAWGLGTKQIVFESDRPGGAGKSDLYLGRLDEASVRYSGLRALEELNTAASESAPTLSDDGLELFFNREGDILRATRGAPPRASARPRCSSPGRSAPTSAMKIAISSTPCEATVAPPS